MFYVECRKSFKVTRGENLFLYRVPKKTLSKLTSLPSVKKNTRQTYFFAEYFFSALDKESVCRVQLFCRVFFYSTQQRACLPSARENALGKHKNTRQRAGFR